MLYPIWNIDKLSGAMVIALISITHVLIAHFAVGAGIFNAITEMKARRSSDETLLKFVRDNSKFLIYLAFVSGALTGVGIWFSIGLVAPEATSFLIRLFVWVWAIEWVFFVLELASGYIYYYSWDRLSPRKHVFIGWIYAVSAYLSLVIINGILTFMLTPGDWLTTGSILDAWMNPSFWPSVFIRTVSALSLAGIFVAIVACARTSRYSPDERARIIRWGAWFLVPLAAMPLLAVWYFWTVPAVSRELAFGGAVAMTFFFAFGVLTSFLIAAFAVFGMLRKPRYINLETALLMLAIAFVATGSMEFVREGIRKPYVLRDVMYSNGILACDVPRLNQEGVLKNAAWVQPDTVNYSGEIAVGEAVYRLQCLRCHEVDGYNAVRPLIKEWNRDLIVSALDHLDLIKPFMPPFIGTEAEKQALASYLASLTNWHDADQGPPEPEAFEPEEVQP